MRELSKRQTDLQYVESNIVAHNYLLKKPRTHDPANESIVPEGSGGHIEQAGSSLQERRRLELFIDLIWVGIVGNLADHFSEQAFSPETKDTVGQAVFEFIILFLIAWRLWKFLQEFMSKYRTNDLVERLFIVWALVLAMGWGNNAPYIFASENSSSLAISLYLVFKVSMVVVETYYSLHLPHIRRRLILQSATSIPILGLWIPAYWYGYPRRDALVLAAIVLEYWATSFLDTPLAARFIKDDRTEILHTGHWVERIQDFYMIILGDGVLNLIKQSPLGEGITLKAGAGVSVLWVYYALSCLFCNGDFSQRYIHAARRTWWRRILWLSFHVSMFACTLILGVSLTYLIQHLDTNGIDPSDREDEETYKLAMSILSAKWVASSTLCIVLLNQTKIALLNRSLDAPRTLKISSRYLRLLPRVLVGVVIVCLPIDVAMDAGTYLSIVSVLLIPVVIWEWVASLSSGGGLIEPRSLS